MKRLLVAALLLGACGDDSPGFDCPEDGDFLEDGTGRYCAYIVVRGGFDCPLELPFAITRGEAMVCTDREGASEDDLPDAVCRRVG